MNQDDIKAGFIRQRRSLFVISLVLTIALVFGIEGTAIRLGPASGTGISVNLGTAKMVYGILAAIWLWFCYRYWVFFKGVINPARQIMVTQIEDMAKVRFKKPFLAKAERVAAEKIRKNNPDLKSLKWELRKLIDPDLNREQRYMKWFLEWRATIDRAEDGPVTTGDNTEADIKIDGWRYDFILWGILLTAYWRERHFSEYYAVWWIACLPILIAILYPEHLQAVLNPNG